MQFHVFRTTVDRNRAGPLSEISAHSYFPTKNPVAFIWVNGLTR